MNSDTLIFDFDGTIADTFHQIVAISNALAGEFNFKLIEPHELESLKNKTTHEVILHLGVPMMKIPKIVARAKEELYKTMSTVQPVQGLHDTLLQLKKLGYELGILTSNSSENVTKFLEKHELNFFDFIMTTSKIWSKNTGLNKLMEDKKLNPGQVIYIGDETRDIEAAKKAGVKIAAVTWGYNSTKALQARKPDYIFNKPEELVELSQSSTHA